MGFYIKVVVSIHPTKWKGRAKTQAGFECSPSPFVQANLPIKFWGECVLAIAHSINRTLSKLLSRKTPHEVIYS